MGEKSPFFSIVVPVYNSEKYLDELIASVLKQTYTDWELILVDDGSTDSSGDLCDSYTKNHSVSVYHTENRGGMAARYYGIQRSKGEYILVADSDDRLTPNCLEASKEIIDSSNCDLIIYGFRSFGNESNEYCLSLQSGKQYGREDIIAAVARDEYYALWNKVIRGDIARKNSLCDLENASMNHDVAMLYPYLVCAGNTYVTDNILYEYRVIETSVSHHITSKKVIDAGRTIGFAMEVLESNDLLSEENRKSIYRTYGKQITVMFDLIKRRINEPEDFEAVKSQRAFREFRKYEKESNIGFKRRIGLRLFRTNRNKMIKLLLRRGI